MTKVLIVDDHPSFRSWARRLLEQSDLYVVGEARDGKEALLAVDMLRPDVVLLDIRLPDMDGFEVADQLADGSSLPIVVLTSTADESDYGERPLRSRVAGFIPKAQLSADAFKKMASL